MQEKDTKKPLLNLEDPTDLEDLEEDEVAQAVEGLKVGQGSGGAPHSIMPDPKMEAEIKEMFQDIVSQYITPIGKSIRLISNGDLSERNLDICIGALKPLILACEEIHYNDIYDVLRSIEQPLIAFREGKKRLLSKKDIRNITTDYKELTRLISRSVGSEMVETSPTGTMRIAPVNASLMDKPIEELQIADALSYFEGVDHKDIQKLYAGGLIKLGLLSQATAQEISESTGITTASAELLKQCAVKALLSLATKVKTPINISTEKPPAIERKASNKLSHEADEDDEIDEDDKTGSISFEDKEFEDDKQKWSYAIESILGEATNYLNSTDSVINELARAHRSLVRMRVAKERFNGEVEFYQDDLAKMLESETFLNEELGTTSNAQRYLLKHIQKIIDSINSAMKKTDLLYSQMHEAAENLQDIESQIISLRRRRIPKNASLVRRRINRQDREEETEETQNLPKRLN
ncbi:MAG: hypothetical protein J0M03_06875 [Acidobacteria bacterium]|nr:hypothetical protein [Acidobacteriota bacterium]